MSKEQQKQKQKDQRLYKTYGITLLEFNLRLDAQNGVCACCGTLPGTGRLCVDHLHQKGFKSMSPENKRKYVRGIVCFMCNTGFKAFEKTIDGPRNRRSLEGTYKYFKLYPLKGEVNG